MKKMSREQYRYYLERKPDKGHIVAGYMLKNKMTKEQASKIFDENVWNVVYTYPELQVGKLYEMVLWNMLEMTPIDLFWMLDRNNRKEFLETGMVPDWDEPDSEVGGITGVKEDSDE